jgi:hypothetical protein
MDTFQARVARLEEHLVTEEKSPDELLAVAEEKFILGDEDGARFYLELAKTSRTLAEVDEEAD